MRFKFADAWDISGSVTLQQREATSLDGRFVRTRVMGRGASGIVYRANDLRDGTEVALKTLIGLTAEERQKLKEEFRLACDLVHPNLVALSELFENATECFFTMDLVSGDPFTDRITGDTPVTEFAAVMAQLIAAVSTLHRSGLLHRDIKPSNVVVNRTGHLVLLDFGLCRTIRRNELSTDVTGTVAYMAPEQVWGEPLPASDWYSVGVLAYEALTGRLPREQDELTDTRTWRTVDAAELPRAIPLPMREAITSLLDPDPLKRCAPSELEHVFGSSPVSLIVPRYDSTPVGRDIELSRLQSAYDKLDKQPILFELVGASGCGKSEICRHFTASLRQSNPPLVLIGRCRLRESVPYQALDEIVASLASYISGELPRMDNQDRASLVQLFPILGPASGIELREEPHRIRQRAARALKLLLNRLTSRCRVVIWIDDTQWGDTESGEIIHYLITGADAPAIFWLLTSRKRHQIYRWLYDASADADSVPLRHALELNYLSATAARLLLERLIVREQASADSAMIERIIRESEGSPLLLQQAAHLLNQRNTNMWLDSPSVGIRQLIDIRLQHLSSDELRLVRLLAVAERPLDREVVLRAASFPKSGDSALNRLCSIHFLRIDDTDGLRSISIQHERIGECVREQVPREHARRLHRQIAESIGALRPEDHYSLFYHFNSGGERTLARKHGYRAAEMAVNALAFKLAAEIYQSLLEVERDRSNRLELQHHLADALQNAGHSSRAAQLYTELAAQDGPQRPLWRLRAIEQLLIGGEMHRGLSLFKTAFGEAGLAFPEGDDLIRATLRQLFGAWLARQRGRFLKNDGNTYKIDLALAAAKGLAVVNPALCAYFSLLALRLAADQRDAERRALASILAGTVLESIGGPLGRWGTGLLLEARRTANAAGSYDLSGCLDACRAQSLLNQAEWDAAQASCVHALRQFKHSKVGHAWEKNLIEMARIRCAEELGELHTAIKRAESWREDADARGDRYAGVTARLFLAFARLVQHDAGGAEAAADEALRPWPGKLTPFHAFYRLRVDAYTSLYREQYTHARTLVEKAETVAERARLLQLPLVRTDFLILKLRTDLLMLSSSSHGMTADSSRVAKTISLLEREDRPDARAHAALFRANLAALIGKHTMVHQWIEQARRGFHERKMKLGILYARACSETLEPDSLGLTETTMHALRDCGIMSGPDWLKIHVPAVRQSAATLR